MKIEETVKTKSAEIRRIAAQHGATNVRLFGSVVRGEAKDESDVDLLVDVTAQTSSWFPTGLILDLEKLLGRRVEVVTERALNKDLRERVLREAVPL
ncbi:MAG: nucleotidyltransferase family protein [Pyrinomonadaceae bacterium]